MIWKSRTRLATLAAGTCLCLGTAAFAQPANDDCLNAVVIPGAPFDSGLIAVFAATNDVGVNPTCDSSSNTDAKQGVWFTFTPTVSGAYQLAETDAQDTSTSVWTGACGGLTQLSCSDPETSTATLTAGTQYWILVSKWSSTSYTSTANVRLTLSIPGACCNGVTGACTVSTTGSAGCASGTTYQGDFTTCTPTNPCPQPPPPANDDCANAINISTLPYDSGSIAVSSATNDAGVNPTCDSSSNPEARQGIWFTFTPTVTGIHNFAEPDVQDTATSIWTGSCGALTQFFCSDPETSTPTLTAGTQYYILISRWSGTTNYAAGNTVRLTVSVPAPPPTNDDCANAIVIPPSPLPTSVTGDNSSATPTTAITPAVCVSSSRDMFYSFTPAVTSTYSFTLCNTVSGTLDTVLSIHTGCPGDGSTVYNAACNDDGCSGSAGPSALTNITLDAGVPYIIRIARWSTGAGGPFRMDISSEPVGTCCSDTGACTIVAQSLCTAPSTFVGNATCSTSACLGACCNAATGACTLTGSTACTGTFNGLGSVCSPNPCPGQACCNATSGACVFTGTDPCPSGTVGLGTGTVCSPNPCPQGACCNDTTGTCTLTASAGCTTGNTYQGDGSLCSPNPCPQPPPPANDECTAAVALTLNVAGNGVFNNATGSDITVCSGSDIDVWFSFTPATSGTFAVTVVPNSASDAGSAIAVFDSCPPITDGHIGTCVAQPGNGATSTVDFPGAGGTTYYIRAGAFTGNVGGFSITVTSIIAGACCNDTTGACTTVTTGICPTGATYQGDNSVCSPSPCPASGACCDPASGACLVRVQAACTGTSTYQGDGSTCSPNPCPQPPPPANDECTAAIALTANVPYSGNNAQATGDGTEGPGGACYTTSPTTFNRAVWFSFTAPTTNSYRVTACGTSFDSVLSVFEGTCAAFGSEIGCDDDTCDGITPTGSTLASDITSVSMTAGQTYLIRLSRWSTTGAGGAYTIEVVGDAGSSNIACCRGATCSVTTNANCTVSAGTAGAFATTATACNSGSSTTPCCYADYNKVGGISVQDIFDFLNDWFAGSNFADTGGDGTTAPDVQAIFDFLNAWFAGGC